MNSQVITGVVRNEAGEPLAGAHIAILDAHSNEIVTAVTNSSGGFRVQNMQAGALTVIADAPGFARSRAGLALASGIGGAHVTLQLSRPGNTCKIRQCTTVNYLRPSESVRATPTSAPETLKARTASSDLNADADVSTVQAAGVNSAAAFTIQTTVAAPAPPRFGFDFAAGSPSANNMFTNDGGMGPVDARLSLSATATGTATTFIDNDCAAGTCQGTDFYKSVGTGYFNGAQARVYHFNTTSNAWQLINSGTVTSYTANSASVNAVDHTVTLNQSGTASQTGDAMWLTLDDLAAPPAFTLLDPRLQAYGQYNTFWTYETGSTLSYMVNHPITASNPQPYTFVADGPPGDNVEVPGANSPLSLEVSDANNEFAGINQYFLGTGTATESLEPTHTYQLSVWLKQTGISNGSVYFNISSGGQIFTSTTFTGVTGSWQQFTFQFPGFQAPPLTVANAEIHFDFQAPGSLLIDQVQISDMGYAALTIDPRVLAAWQTFAPATMRIWTNFGNSGGGYSFWGLDSWLAADSADHVDPGIGNINEVLTLHAHLPSSLAIAKSVGADPWLICNMSLSEAEWGNLIDYLAAPAGTGYAALRPASHPGPYTSDFNHIYLEFGNEEWGTQETAVNGHYGQWVHYMLSQAIAGKSYFDPTKIKFIVNGFTLVPSIGSAAAAAAPEASVVDIFTYNNGDMTLIPSGATTYPDAYYQTDLFSLIRTTAAYGTSVQNLINAQVAQQKADAANGLVYSLAVYEGGPGGDITATQGDTSLAAAVGNLDTFLYSSLMGIQQQNFFLFNFGVGPYSSHSYLWNGFRPHPVWEALQMRNQYCHGDMVNVATNSVPVTSDTNAFPLISTYAFHEVNASGLDQVDVVVLSRDLNNSTPVTLNLPGASTGTGTLYTLTGDPRTNNDTTLNIPIGTTALSGVSPSYTFTMPPGSVYLFQFPLTSYGGSSSSGATSSASLPSAVLAFGSQTDGTTSAPQQVTLSNTGLAALTIASVVVSGTNASEFSSANNCGSALAAGASCSISISFTPTAPGSASASLVVTDNSGNSAGSTQTIGLTGTGAAPVTNQASVAYKGADPYTVGDWTGVYGADGQIIANGLQNVPAYANVGIVGDSTWTWTTSTTDPRALQSASGSSSRISSTYFSATSFTINVSLTDGNTHKISLYLCDWDSSGRAETVSILDASSGAVLSTQSFSSFTGGVYESWMISGNVNIQVTRTAGNNGIVNAIFFDPTTVAVGSSATYTGLDSTTQGNWTGKYGADGQIIANGGQNVPSYANFEMSGESAWTWTTSTTDVRALQTASGATTRIASTYFSATAFALDVNLTDGKTHKVSLYLCDWDDYSRAETISIVDAASQTVLNTQSFSFFTGGAYASWTLQGHVQIIVTRTAGNNSVVNAVFFDPLAVASYVGTDTTTKGKWTGKYGADGQIIANGLQNIPAYASYKISGQSALTWSTSTTDSRALQTASGSTKRIASAYYSATVFTIDLNLTDGNTHKVSLYLCDWDSSGRAETVSIIDPLSGKVLNTESFSSFVNGVWAPWNIKGHVQIQVTFAAGKNAVTSGIFFN